MAASAGPVALPIPFPCDFPSGFIGSDPSEPVFDPTIHLQIEPPKYLIGLDYKEYSFPLSEEDKKIFPGISVSAPFRILSDEGLRVVRSVYTKNKDFQLGKHRQARSIRGLGYMSQFIRDFNNCPLLCTFFSHMAQEKLAAHTMPLNYSHINVGAIGADIPVDPWHIDSVDYVMVLIVSDITDMVGGELQVIMHPHEKSFELLNTGKLTESDIITANYKGAGYCMFMQGSRMVHHVSKVQSGREPRVSLVNSFSSCVMSNPDRTKFDTFFRGGDPPQIAFNEYARHKAWRAEAMMRDIVNNTRPQENNKEVLDKLIRARDELTKAVEIMSGKLYDGIGYFDEQKKIQVSYNQEQSM